MPTNRLPPPVPPTKESRDSANDALIPVRMRVRDGQAIGLVDMDGNDLGLPVTTKKSAQGVVKGIAPSGTVAADGTLTLGTALPAVFAAGLWLYLPAGAIVGGAEGFYWTDMSSTTVGVVRAGQGGAALVGSASAYTGVTTEVTAWSSSVDAGRLGIRRIEAAAIHANNANVKSFRMRFGAAQCALASGASNTSSVLNVFLQRISAGLQVTTNAGATGASGVMAVTTTDDTAAQAITITLQVATATDYMLCVLYNQITMG